jgi:hypothetical protein
MNYFRTFWFHILVWGTMIIYFLVAPDLFALVFTKNGKPHQTDNVIPAESDQITFVVDGLEPYVKDGEKLYKMYGWAIIAPEGGASKTLFDREIVLVSEKRRYFFSVVSEHRDPGLPGRFTDVEVDLDSLGFSFLIAEDLIEPGKYRIGMIFRDVSTGSALYWDKPVQYLIKTPNTLRLEKK